MSATLVDLADELTVAVRAVEDARGRFDELPDEAPEPIRDAVMLELRAAELRRDAILAEARKAVPA